MLKHKITVFSSYENDHINKKLFQVYNFTYTECSAHRVLLLGKNVRNLKCLHTQTIKIRRNIVWNAFEWKENSGGSSSFRVVICEAPHTMIQLPVQTRLLWIATSLLYIFLYRLVWTKYFRQYRKWRPGWWQATYIVLGLRQVCFITWKYRWFRPKTNGGCSSSASSSFQCQSSGLLDWKLWGSFTVTTQWVFGVVSVQLCAFFRLGSDTEWKCNKKFVCLITCQSSDHLLYLDKMLMCFFNSTYTLMPIRIRL